MGIAIHKYDAIRILRTAAAEGAPVDKAWTERLRSFSTLIEEGDQPRTHIAFLGTAILAKAVDPRVDPFAIKQKSGATAYSARGVCHNALVPEAVPLRIDLGVRGREPLNNQPYFRERRVSMDMPVHEGTRPVVRLLVEMLADLDAIRNKSAALRVLAAFVTVRREHAPAHHALIETSGEVDPTWLISRIRAFVAARSEGGRRAQAVAAGLMDVVAEGRVEAGRINDPDRHLPGDIGVRRLDKVDTWERVVEVRDKPVTASDAYAFASKCLEVGVHEAAILSVGSVPLDSAIGEAVKWAKQRGLTLITFKDWSSFVSQALFWAETPSRFGAAKVLGSVQVRLIEVDASAAALKEWAEIARQAVGSFD